MIFFGVCGSFYYLNISFIIKNALFWSQDLNKGRVDHEKKIIQKCLVTQMLQFAEYES